MTFNDFISIPSVVRIKKGAIDRLGIYLARPQFTKVSFFYSPGIDSIIDRARLSLKDNNITILDELLITDASFEHASELFTHLSSDCHACIGIGGGKALDVARYVSFLANKPFYSVPTALSNDSFCSPQSSLTVGGKRRSLPSKQPYAVVVDTQICLDCPDIIWFAGIGDLMGKVSAIVDWKMAFHAVNTPVNDLAALLSDATVFQFMACPERTLEGIKILATALMMNGVAMEIAGSSRPASGSEHLISHALDRISRKPRMHGLQVGVATYVCSLLQKQTNDRLGELFEKIGFWDFIAQEPFSTSEWTKAIQLAPSIKNHYYTVLSSRDCVPEFLELVKTNKYLKRCFS
ncbi:MAG: iron-containing alcohol dehydrogenase family protein [Candidatus Sumerlaeales bacterium]|nr:iron-containing alcohol dehydrogenase family protein [Candidatus Sumerlaeales bacterium]